MQLIIACITKKFKNKVLFKISISSILNDGKWPQASQGKKSLYIHTHTYIYIYIYIYIYSNSALCYYSRAGIKHEFFFFPHSASFVTQSFIYYRQSSDRKGVKWLGNQKEKELDMYHDVCKHIYIYIYIYIYKNKRCELTIY